MEPIRYDSFNQLSSLGDSLRDLGLQNERRNQNQQQEGLFNKAAEVYSRRDPQEISKFIIQNPEVAGVLNQQIGYANDRTKDIVTDTLISAINTPDQTQRDARIQQGIDAIKANGGNPQYLTQALGVDYEELKPDALMTLGGLGERGRGAVNSYLSMQQQPKPNKLTDIKTTENGQLIGYNAQTGSYEAIPMPDGSKIGKKGPTTVVNNVTKAQGEQDKVIAKNEGEIYNGYINDAATARKNDLTLNRLEKLNDKAFDGVGAGAYKSAAKLAKAIGIDVEGLNETELFESLSNELVLGQTSKLVGVLTDTDMQLLASTVPHLSQTKEGRKKLISVMKEINQASKEQAKLAREYRASDFGGKERGSFDDIGFQEFLDSKPKKDRFGSLLAGEGTVLKGQSEPKTMAPSAALEALRANPSLIDQFEQKYGYRPEGM